MPKLTKPKKIKVDGNECFCFSNDSGEFECENCKARRHNALIALYELYLEQEVREARINQRDFSNWVIKQHYKGLITQAVIIILRDYLAQLRNARE